MKIGIGEIPHIIVDNDVYKGSIDEILYLVTVKAEDMLPAKIIEYIKTA